MSAIEVKAATNTAPWTDGTNDTNEGLLSMGLTHAAMLIPEAWEGCTIEVTCRGTATKSGWFLVSELSTAEVDRSVTADAAGAFGPTLGRRVVVGETKPFDIPVRSGPGKRLYLINETDDATTTAELSVVSMKVA